MLVVLGRQMKPDKFTDIVRPFLSRFPSFLPYRFRRVVFHLFLKVFALPGSPGPPLAQARPGVGSEGHFGVHFGLVLGFILGSFWGLFWLVF